MSLGARFDEEEQDDGEKLGYATGKVKGSGGTSFTRDERMRIQEKIPLGPEEFPPNLVDPNWEKKEPYSRIALA